jgi:hypothetical protein
MGNQSAECGKWEILTFARASPSAFALVSASSAIRRASAASALARVASAAYPSMSSSAFFDTSFAANKSASSCFSESDEDYDEEEV